MISDLQARWSMLTAWWRQTAPARWWQRRPRWPQPATRSARRRRRLQVVGVVVVLGVVMGTQLNGPLGAWAADRMRAILGPAATAQLEAWYLGVSDALTQAKYHLPGQTVQAPYQVVPTATNAPGVTPTPAAKPAMPPMPLANLPPLVTPTLPGEGLWSPVATLTGAPGAPPIVAKTFYRPDPSRPYAIVTLLQIDLRAAQLHLVAGKSEPGGPLGHAGAGVIPAADQAGQQLLAAFNGGFKYADGHYGLMTGGKVYVPAVYNQGTLAITAQGQVIIGAWGVDPQFSASNPNLVAWRQNGALLISQGAVNPATNDGAVWGGTVLNSAYTWRSGIGVTAGGALLFAGGNAISAATLGQTMLAAGAVTALQLDINPFWVRAFTYARGTDGALHPTKLDNGMQGSGLEYLQGDARDFFYVTRRPPAP